MARFKVLRGTAIDPFGWTHERRSERALRDEYFEMIDGLLAKLDAQTLPAAILQAAWPEEIRGYGPIKGQSIEKARRKLAAIAILPRLLCQSTWRSSMHARSTTACASQSLLAPKHDTTVCLELENLYDEEG